MLWKISSWTTEMKNKSSQRCSCVKRSFQGESELDLLTSHDVNKVHAISLTSGESQKSCGIISRKIFSKNQYYQQKKLHTTNQDRFYLISLSIAKKNRAGDEKVAKWMSKHVLTYVNRKVKYLSEKNDLEDRLVIS